MCEFNVFALSTVIIIIGYLLVAITCWHALMQFAMHKCTQIS